MESNKGFFHEPLAQGTFQTREAVQLIPGKLLTWLRHGVTPKGLGHWSIQRVAYV